MTEAYFKKGNIVSFSEAEIDELKNKTNLSLTGRFRYCLHQDHSDQIQEMIIGISKDSYCRPHRHPIHFSESYHIIQGELLILFFDQNGNEYHRETLEKNGKNVIRINHSVIHMPISLSDVTVYHETLTGPFDKENMVEYMDWAPDEQTNQAVEYLNKMKQND